MGIILNFYIFGKMKVLHDFKIYKILKLHFYFQQSNFINLFIDKKLLVNLIFAKLL